MEVSVVIPVYNSELILPILCQQLKDALQSHLYEVILINDGSPDESWSVIERICDNNEAFRGICLTRNFGQDNAIIAGLHHARGNFVVIMDDDLQHSPYDIGLLLRAGEAGSDVCYADYSHAKFQSWWKNLGSFLNAKQAEYLIAKPRDIYLSPFKSISRMVVDSILSYQGPYPYIDGLIFRSTTSIVQVPVKHHKRQQGLGNYNLKKSLSVFMKHATGFSVVPLRFASLCGVGASFISVFLAFYYIYQFLVDDMTMRDGRP